MFHVKRYLGLIGFEATLLKLTASSVDVSPARVTDRSFNAVLQKAALKLFNLHDGRRLERAVLDIVELNQIDMAERTLTELNKCVHLGVVVVDAVDHGVLVGGTTPGFLNVQLDCFMKARKRVFFHAGHELIARGLNGGVQGDSQGKLLGKIGKTTNPGNDSAGRNGKMTCTDGKALGIIEGSKGFENVVEVVEGLALAHENNARHALTKVLRNMENLVDDLAGGKGAGKAGETRCAKSAAHAASSLSGNADGKLVPRWHSYGFYGDAVGELEKILARTVARDLLNDLFGSIKAILFFKSGTKRLGKIGHLFERTYVLNGNPFVKLLGAERGLTARRDNLGEFGIGKISDIPFTDNLLHDAPFNTLKNIVTSTIRYLRELQGAGKREIRKSTSCLKSICC